MTASLSAFVVDDERLRKKLTVIGITGHTQGVSKAKRPPRKLVRNKPHRDRPLPVPVCESMVTGAQVAESKPSS